MSKRAHTHSGFLEMESWEQMSGNQQGKVHPFPLCGCSFEFLSVCVYFTRVYCAFVLVLVPTYRYHGSRGKDPALQLQSGLISTCAVQAPM